MSLFPNFSTFCRILFVIVVFVFVLYLRLLGSWRAREARSTSSAGSARRPRSSDAGSGSRSECPECYPENSQKNPGFRRGGDALNFNFSLHSYSNRVQLNLRREWKLQSQVIRKLSEWYFRKGLPNETQCYSLVNLTPSGLFRILHIE